MPGFAPPTVHGARLKLTACQSLSSPETNLSPLLSREAQNRNTLVLPSAGAPSCTCREHRTEHTVARVNTMKPLPKYAPIRSHTLPKHTPMDFGRQHVFQRGVVTAVVRPSRPFGNNCYRCIHTIRSQLRYTCSFQNTMGSAYFLSVILNPLPPRRRFFTTDSCTPESCPFGKEWTSSLVGSLFPPPSASARGRSHVSRRFAAFAAPALTAGQSRLQQRNRRAIRKKIVPETSCTARA